MEFSTATNGLKKGLKNGGLQEAVLTAREWNQIREQVNVHQPFGETTDFTQEERNMTISAVVPYILSLNHHLLYQKNVKKIKQNKKTNKKACETWMAESRKNHFKKDPVGSFC